MLFRSWQHPKLGFVSPASFIPVAEETGLIVEIGEWVLRQACKVAATWPGDVRLAVNISTLQLRRADFVNMVIEALAESRLAAGRLELEITESVLLSENEIARQSIHILRQTGVHIALDDFGTGYSSLSYLRNMPIDRIKIDTSFTANMMLDPGCRVIVRALVGLARDLGMAITAEGVETREHLDALVADGCGEAQGWLIGRPMQAAAIAAVLHRRDAALSQAA